MILYVSESGGMVTKEYEGTPDEEADNLVVAKIVADAWGCTVALLGRATTMYTKSADVAIYWRGKTDAELWEIKTNHTGTHNSVSRALRKANKQAENVLLRIVSDISDNDLLNGIKGRMKLTKIQQVAVIKNGNIKIYTRSELLNSPI